MHLYLIITLVVAYLLSCLDKFVKQGLAYSCAAYHSTPEYKDQSYYFISYVGTQSDKLEKAVKETVKLVSNPPFSTEGLKSTQVALNKKLATQRVQKLNIFWSKENAQKKGFKADPRAVLFEQLNALDTDEKLLNSVKDFHKKEVANKKRTFIIIGDKTKLDMDFIRSLGKLKEIQLSDVYKK